ncbi:hypothetical protein DFH08DRAFT_819735 [Mycena albidolilacea]|uniref:CxC2-like cysteine cluster KDZ transposase-associated domain-containing protein n=1 Tax=Mycena albidolilacea TaxID=1033008 RepID=A0AAD6ZEE6_9AGAR|nr:hypothetical protein DFH08DRAFT_819735 [Mycena albidolilacea]
MSHKCKIKPHSLVIAGTAASVSHRTQDNRRQRTRMSVVEQGAGVADATATDHFWADDLATNMARHSEDFSYQLGDTSLESQPDEPADNGINVVVVQSAGRNTKSRRKSTNIYLSRTVRCKIGFRIGTSIYWRTYAARDEVPQKITLGALVVHVWIPDENVRFANARARQFGVVWIKRASGKASTTRVATANSLIQKWNGSNFVRGRRWLQELGLRVQLGHPPGVICPYRQAAAHDFVLYDLTGVHEMNVDFCGCPKDAQPDSPPEERRTQLLRACWWPATITAPNTCATFRALRHFQIINCLGKLSAYDFLRGLEMCTNHDGLDKPPDRRRPFMHIVRQWREVKRHKRAKRGHDEGGIAATKQGELAIPCRACPQPGWNLPPNWENINPFYRFIYIVFLAADANFRLGNRCVSSEASDPILGDGFGYFCRRHGEDGYYAHIAKHVDEEEISNCSGFRAMFLANSKRVRGLRTTGVGGVTCSRHNMWRANGIGDLQVGERQCNIDFVVLSALMTFAMAWLVFSYDIACQYAIKFWERMAKMPEAMHLKLPPADVWWMVPNFHLPDHLTKCRSPFSFHWMRGAGMTNGEGIEQSWVFSNGAAPSTRLMGPGSRQATLEDVFGFHNYDRLLAMHRILPKRLAVAIKDGNQHRVAFDAFSTGLEEARPEQIKEWRAWVERWESTQHTTPEDSPFDMPEEVTSLRQIQLEIAMEEFVCTSEGVEIEREHTPSTFIIMGLHIEESQRRLEVSVRALRNPSPSQKLDFTKRRIALLKRIHKFRELQTVYMPSVRAVLTNVQKQMYDGGGDELPEVSRLFMPSEIADPRSRERVCAMGLPTLEARLREAEATEALESVRAGLRTRTMTNRYKLRNYTGQGLMTKGQGILRQINIRIHIAKLRYRYSRAALVALRGHGDWEERLRMLNDDDIRGLNERALTAEEKAQNKQWADIGGAIIEGGITRAAGVASGEGSHTLSWIWYQVGAGEGENDKRLEEALRVEWCKALARSSRYTEEVMLLREEMRRTIAYGQTAAMQWDALAVAELPGASAEVTEGRCAYAAEQAATERARCTDLERRWTGLLMRADAYLEGRNLVDLAAPVTVEVDIADELDAEEEEARLEGEEEEEGALPEGQ